MSSAGKPRRYHSPLRAEQAAATRTAILRAAQGLFDERGWQVGVREIADAAGCSVETIYSAFGSKLGLLLAVVDVSAVGDEADVPLADRPEVMAIGVGTPAERVAKVSALALAIHRRSAGNHRAMVEAARVDEAAAREVTLMHERIAISQRHILTLLLGREPDEAEVLDVAVLASVATYLILTEQRGLSADEYVAWLSRQLHQLIRTPRRNPR